MNEPSAGPSGKQTPLTTMAAKGVEPARDPPLPEEESDHKLLLVILANQKAAKEKQDKRHNDLDKSIAATKQSLDKHIEENDKALSAIKGNVLTNTTDIQTLQASVTKLQSDLLTIQSKYDATQKLLDETSSNLESYASTISKPDTKYVKDKKELLRCQLIIDGVKENQGNCRPKLIVINLQVDYVDADIKSAYRLGPINDKATRPRSIKVLFASNLFKYDIFKSIKNLKDKDQRRSYF